MLSPAEASYFRGCGAGGHALAPSEPVVRFRLAAAPDRGGGRAAAGAAPGARARVEPPPVIVYKVFEAPRAARRVVIDARVLLPVAGALGGGGSAALVAGDGGGGSLRGLMRLRAGRDATSPADGGTGNGWRPVFAQYGSGAVRVSATALAHVLRGQSPRVRASGGLRRPPGQLLTGAAAPPGATAASSLLTSPLRPSSVGRRSGGEPAPIPVWKSSLPRPRSPRRAAVAPPTGTTGSSPRRRRPVTAAPSRGRRVAAAPLASTSPASPFAGAAPRCPVMCRRTHTRTHPLPHPPHAQPYRWASGGGSAPRT